MQKHGSQMKGFQAMEELSRGGKDPAGAATRGSWKFLKVSLWSDLASPQKCAENSRAEKPRWRKVKEIPEENFQTLGVKTEGDNPGRFSSVVTDGWEAGGIVVSGFCLQGGTDS